MNMVGHPRHVAKACAVGADIICAQGAEAGGHTGDIPTSVLLPACADACARYKSPLTGKPVALVAAGGVYDGRSLAAALMYGAQAVWLVFFSFFSSLSFSSPSEFKREGEESKKRTENKDRKNLLLILKIAITG
jgi:hypothetical protein